MERGARTSTLEQEGGKHLLDPGATDPLLLGGSVEAEMQKVTTRQFLQDPRGFLC